MTDGLSQCPHCDGELERQRELERPIRVGDDIALVSVNADVCLRCGEMVLSRSMMERLEKARQSLTQNAADAPVMGRVYDFRSGDTV